MVSRRYTDDYRLEHQLAPNGRIRAVAVYKGEWFAFDASAAALAVTRRVYVGCTVLAAALWTLALCVPPPVGRVWYLMLPMALGAVPLWLAVASMARLLTAKEKVTREHRDKLGGRYAGAGIGMAACGGAALVGALVRLCLGGAGGPGVLFALCAAGFAGCGGALFALRKGLAMHALAAQ